jgi:ribosomal protein S26
MTEPASKLVTVGSYVMVSDAEFARMLLESEGIEAFVADATIVSMDWLLGNAIGWVKVQVESANEERARALLAAWQEEIRNRPPPSETEAVQCIECGQEMPQGVAICPACGWTYLGNDPGAAKE